MPKFKKGTYQDKFFLLFIILPYLILFVLTTGPLLYSFVSSFFNWVLYEPDKIKFIGLKNYIFMLGSENFWNALKNTIYQVGVTVSLQLVIGMIFALLLSREDIFLSRIAKAVFLLPIMMTPVVVGLTWRMLYNPGMGLINYYLSVIGIQGPNWLGSSTWAMPSIIITDLWLSTPFMTMLLFAGLQSLPQEPYEAALVDGANGLQTFFYVTLPLLRPIIFLALLFRLMDAFRRFETIFIMTGGGPGRVTETLNLYTYFEAFNYLNMGYASTLAVTLVIIMLAVSLFLIRMTKNSEGR